MLASTTRRLARLALALLLLVASGGRAPGAESEGRRRATVMPITGSDGRVETRLARALGDTWELVPASTWEQAAARLFAPAKRAEDIAVVAADLRVAVLVTGSIKPENGRPTLHLTLRHGPTGQRAGRLAWPLDAGGVTEAILDDMAQKIGPAMQAAARGPAKGAAAGAGDDGGASNAGASPPSGTAPSPQRDAARPADAPEHPAGRTADDKAPVNAPAHPRHPPWHYLYRAALGVVIEARTLSTSPGGTLWKDGAPGAGPRLELEGFPLALLLERPERAASQAWNALAGLGVGLTLDAPLRGPAGVNELRFEGGLRWRYVPLMRPETVEVRASVQGGLHTFSIARAAGPDIGPPDTAYGYLALGAAVRVPFHPAIALLVGANLLVLGDAGPIATAREFGPAGGLGYRVLGGLDVRLWRGLRAGLEAFYEAEGLTFSGAGMPLRSATSASDQSLGGAVTIGWRESGELAPPPPPPPAPPPRPRDTDRDGIVDGDDQCPDLAGPAATHGCPDKDGDGIVDSEDRCPAARGPADLVGCPDSDGDGIIDGADDCPEVSGLADNKGCPGYKAVRMSADRIVLLEKIVFGREADLTARARAILDEVARALGDHPGIHLRIVGHVDKAGSEQKQLDLSAARADAVMEYLVSHGIDGGRLEAQGYGARSPVGDNRTPAGREENRRIELWIVK